MISLLNFKPLLGPQFYMYLGVTVFTIEKSTLSEVPRIMIVISQIVALCFLRRFKKILLTYFYV